MSSVANTFFPNNVANSNEINIPGLKVSQNRISLSTDDSERLWIDSQGKVGIGTSNPNQLLHLYQADSNEVQLKITNADTTNGVLIGLTADEDFQIKSRDTGKHIFLGTNDGTDMTIEAGGNVGIGTTNPSELLHINNSTGGSTQIRFTNADGGSSLMGIDSSEDVVIKERAGNNLKFFVNDLEKMRIDTNGNVGIGTDAPATILHIESATPSFRMENGTYSFDMGQNADGEIDMHNISNAGNIAFNFRNNSGTSLCKLNNDLSVNFANNNTITATGNVGIGTNNPSDNLHIYNSFTKLVVEATNNATGNLTNSIDLLNSWQRRSGLRMIDSNNTSRLWLIGKDYNGGSSNTSFSFLYSSDSGSTYTEYMRITNAGNIGLGTSPSYQLELSTDSAAKPSTNTWTISSDSRLKENIQVANYETCYNNMKLLDLKYFKWKDEYIETHDLKDNHRIGWLADDVEAVFPKSVQEVSGDYPEIGISGPMKTLNSDMIIANMYGALRKVMDDLEDLRGRVR